MAAEKNPWSILINGIDCPGEGEECERFLLMVAATVLAAGLVGWVLGWRWWQRRSSAAAGGPADWEVSELWVYPIKSCAGIPLQEAAFDAHGFELDRRWMLVDAGSSTTGLFITQRVYPSLALVRPRYSTTSLLVDAPDMPTLKVPPSLRQHCRHSCGVIWRWRV